MRPQGIEIRECGSADLPEMFAVINEAARVYRTILDPGHYHEPYMSMDELAGEAARVRFYAAVDAGGAILGVMGLERVKDVALIRHGYVRPDNQRRGIGSALLRHLEALAGAVPRIIIGTYRDNAWAQAHLVKHGYSVAPDSDGVLELYYDIPPLQRTTSIAYEKRLPRP